MCPLDGLRSAITLRSEISRALLTDVTWLKLSDDAGGNGTDFDQLVGKSRKAS